VIAAVNERACMRCRIVYVGADVLCPRCRARRDRRSAIDAEIRRIEQARWGARPLRIVDLRKRPA